MLEELIKRSEKSEELKNNLILSSKYKCYPQYLYTANRNLNFCEKPGYFDILEYYQSLKRYPQPVTIELIEQISKDLGIEFNKEKIIQLEKIQYAIYGTFLLEDQGFKICYTNYKNKINKTSGHFVLKLFDAFANIKVYNATWAKLVPHGKGEYEIPMDQVEDYFTFPDITLSNPIFNCTEGTQLKIETDGTDFSYDGIIIDFESRCLIARLENSYAVTQFPSKNLSLFLGHLWYRSFVCQTYENNPIVYQSDEHSVQIK